MATLYGKTYTRAELLAYVGDVSQVGGAQWGALTDGRAHGLRIAHVRTGSGLDYQVLVDRALDLGLVTYNGIPLTYLSPGGWAAPYYYEPEGQGWIRTFGGGLLTTCGLTQVGNPTEDAGEALGIHGRISNLPAVNVCLGGEWQGDEYEFWVEGEVRQAVLYGENLRLRRRISGRLGEAVIHIRDRVENMGGRRSPFMILYHCNFGHPLLAEGARILWKPHRVVARDKAAEPGLAEVALIQAPDARWEAQVFYHDMVADADGWVTLAIANRHFNQGQGLGLVMRYRQAELPFLTHWKQFGVSDYVMGLEPGNCHVEGRVWEREHGTLQYLEPGEQRDFALEFRILPDNDAIDALGL
jgi:hypothetical protein